MTEIARRRLIGYTGTAVLAGAMAPMLAASTGRAEADGRDPIPADAKPGGAYDRYVARLAAEDRFSGVVLLSYKGRTVLSRSYGMADKERGIRNHEGVAVNLSSASQPFLAVAILQLVERGGLRLSDTVGTHLRGFATDIAEKVNIHHLLTTTGGLSAPQPDWERVFTSRDEVHKYHERWTRQAELVAVPGSDSQAHSAGAGAGLAIAAQIVEAVSGMTFWDYVHEHVFRRAGMTGSAYFTRTQWLTDPHIAHSYMRQADGGRVDAVRNLDKGSVNPAILGRNPGRAFIGNASGDGFVTAPDLVRFAQALSDGTVLGRAFADLFTGPKLPGPASAPGSSYRGYTMPIHLLDGRWLIGRGGGTAGSSANWNIYLDAGWVGVVLSNYDDIPFQEILGQEQQAITGRPADPPGGGG